MYKRIASGNSNTQEPTLIFSDGPCSAMDIVLRLGETKVSDIVRRILTYELPKVRVTTQGQYKIYLNELSREIGRFKLDDFDLMIFEEWLADFRIRKERKTYNDYIKYLNKIYRYAYNRRLCTHQITFPLIDPKKRVGRIFTDDELHLMWGWMGKELKDQYTIAIECYMRKTEVLQLDWSMVDFTKECFVLGPEHVKTGSKTGVGRSIPWTPNVKSIVERLHKKGTKYLFPNKTDTGPVKENKTAWQLSKKRAGITGRARWHDLRGTGLTEAVYGSKKGIEDVAKVAGLSVRTLERVYAQPNVGQLRSAVGAIVMKSN